MIDLIGIIGIMLLPFAALLIIRAVFLTLNHLLDKRYPQ